MASGDNNRKLSVDDLATIKRLYETPTSDGSYTGVTTLANMFDVANNCIQYHLQKMGVIMRSSKEAYANGKRTKPVKTCLPKENQLHVASVDVI